MVFQQTLPAPTWHGFDREMIAKYIAFLERFSPFERQKNDLERDIQSSREIADVYLREIRECQRRIADIGEQLVTLEQIQEPTDEDYRRAAENAAMLPFVLGSRINTFGRLVFQLRMAFDDEWGRRDLGDIEIELSLNSNGRVPVNIVRDGPDSRVLTQVLRGRDLFSGDSSRFSVQLDQFGQWSSLMSELNIVELLNQLYDGCRRINVFRGSSLEPPAPLWTGHWPHLAEALKRSRSVVSDTEGAIRRLQQSKEAHEGSFRAYKHELAATRASIRQKSAELSRLQEQAEAGIQIDQEQAARDLEYMTHLPGVMGFKFDDQGTPVIHIRASHFRDERRWDFGDYQFTFRPHATISDGVLKATKTRGRHGLWDQNGRDFWFCFGGRSADINRLFRGGNFPDMLHLMINSLNGVNQGSEYHLDGRYDEIPPGLVWQTGDGPVKRHRPRRRRRLS